MKSQRQLSMHDPLDPAGLVRPGRPPTPSAAAGGHHDHHGRGAGGGDRAGQHGIGRGAGPPGEHGPRLHRRIPAGCRPGGRDRGRDHRDRRRRRWGPDLDLRGCRCPHRGYLTVSLGEALEIGVGGAGADTSKNGTAAAGGLGRSVGLGWSGSRRWLRLPAQLQWRWRRDDRRTSGPERDQQHGPHCRRRRRPRRQLRSLLGWQYRW